MPRFTLIEVDNFLQQNLLVPDIQTHLKRGKYLHRNDIDFSSEAEIINTAEAWTNSHEPMTRMIAEYEKREDSQQWQINRITVKSYVKDHALRLFTTTHAYVTSLIVEVNPEGIMCSNILPLVHQPVTDMLKRLQIRYQGFDETTCLTEMKATFAKRMPTDFPEWDPVAVGAAQRFINSLDSIANEREGGSGLTVGQIIALVWTAINDEQSHFATKEDALKGFIQNICEIQAAQGNNAGEQDKPICIRSAISHIVETLNVTHPDGEIMNSVIKLATLKLPVLVRKYAVDFIKNSPEKTRLFEQIQRNSRTEGYSLPDSVLEAIKSSVKKVFDNTVKNKFETYVKSEHLDEIFKSIYADVKLTPYEFIKIRMLIVSEEQVELLRDVISNVSNDLKKNDRTGKDEQKIEGLDKTLNGMLDQFMEGIKKRGGTDIDFHASFKKDVTQCLNKSGLFNASTGEILRHKILTALNRLIAVLSGKKIASISSRTDFFERKQVMQASMKQEIEQAMHDLPRAGV